MLGSYIRDLAANIRKPFIYLNFSVVDFVVHEGEECVLVSVDINNGSAHSSLKFVLVFCC